MSSMWRALLLKRQGADIFRLETKDEYPADHTALLNRAALEQRNNARPEIRGKISDFEGYDTVFVGYPIWNADLPPVLYTFFDGYDLSGKKVVPFTVHGGSGLAATPRAIARLEPKAVVEQNAFSESRNTVDSCKERVSSWLKKIGEK